MLKHPSPHETQCFRSPQRLLGWMQSRASGGGMESRQLPCGLQTGSKSLDSQWKPLLWCQQELDKAPGQVAGSKDGKVGWGIVDASPNPVPVLPLLRPAGSQFSLGSTSHCSCASSMRQQLDCTGTVECHSTSYFNTCRVLVGQPAQIYLKPGKSSCRICPLAEERPSALPAVSTHCPVSIVTCQSQCKFTGKRMFTSRGYKSFLTHENGASI